MSILQTTVFCHQQQSLDGTQAKALRRAVKAVSKNPRLGKPANASLADILVYRFGVLNKSWLLSMAYRQSEEGLTLLALNVGKQRGSIA